MPPHTVLCIKKRAKSSSKQISFSAYGAFKNKPSEICLANEKHRWAVYYALVIALLAGYIMQSGGFGSSGFGMYAGF